MWYSGSHLLFISCSFYSQFIWTNIFWKGAKHSSHTQEKHAPDLNILHRACIYYTGPVYITMLIHKKIRKTVNIYLPEHFGALNIVWDGLSLTWDDEIFVNTESTFRLFAVDNMLSKFSKSP